MEIERKFLLSGEPDWLASLPSAGIEQGYIVAEKDVEVRIRNADNTYLLTTKRGEGLAREEVEIALSREQFDALWPLTSGRRIIKRRYRRELEAGQVIEYDVYGGALAGLVVAEVEFETVEDSKHFEPPAELAREVTGDAHYANKRLALQGKPDEG